MCKKRQPRCGASSPKLASSPRKPRPGDLFWVSGWLVLLLCEKEQAVYNMAYIPGARTSNRRQSGGTNSEQFETLTLCIADSRPSITIGSGLCSSRLETRRLVGIGPVKHSWLHGRSLAVLQRSLRTLHPAWTSEVDVWDYNRSTPLSSFEWGCERVITATCPSF